MSLAFRRRRKAIKRGTWSFSPRAARRHLSLEQRERELGITIAKGWRSPVSGGVYLWVVRTAIERRRKIHRPGTRILFRIRKARLAAMQKTGGYFLPPVHQP